MDIIESLKKTMNQSSINEFSNFINQYPKHGAWHIISDYCLEDKNKMFDSITFSVLSNHDTIENIKEVVKNIAPKDFKNTRSINYKFQNYINSQVFYHFTFLLEKKDSFYKKILNLENITSLLEFVNYYSDQQKQISPEQIIFWDSVKSHNNLLKDDMRKKSFNQRLTRQIITVASMYSLILYYLHIENMATLVSWISDRDKIIDKYDSFIFDLAYVFFTMNYSEMIIKSNNINEKQKLFVPDLKFITPNQGKENYLDELIRVPDYLVGLLANLDVEKIYEKDDKYKDMLNSCIREASNHTIIQIILENNGESIYTRRVKIE